MNLGFGFEMVAHWHSIPVREYIQVYSSQRIDSISLAGLTFRPRASFTMLTADVPLSTLDTAHAVAVQVSQHFQMHSHPDYIVYTFTASKVRFTSPEGKTTEAEAKTGQTTWHAAETHAGEICRARRKPRFGDRTEERASNAHGSKEKDHAGGSTA